MRKRLEGVGGSHWVCLRSLQCIQILHVYLSDCLLKWEGDIKLKKREERRVENKEESGRKIHWGVCDRSHLTRHSVDKAHSAHTCM